MKCVFLSVSFLCAVRCFGTFRVREIAFFLIVAKWETTNTHVDAEILMEAGGTYKNIYAFFFC